MSSKVLTTFMDRLRERKKVMRFTLTRDEIIMVNAIVRRPDNLPLQEVGLKQYSVKDGKEAKVQIRLTNWILEKLLERGPAPAEGAEPVYTFPTKLVETGLKQVYLEHLLDLMKYYQPVGNLTSMSATYYPLLWKLEGTDVVHEDATEEVVSANS